MNSLELLRDKTNYIAIEIAVFEQNLRPVSFQKTR